MCKNAKHHPMDKPKHKVKPTPKTKGKKKKPPTLDEEQSFTERIIKARAAAFGKKVVAVIEARYRNKGCNVPWERDCKNPYKGPTLPPKNEKPVYGKGKKKPPVGEEEEAVVAKSDVMPTPRDDNVRTAARRIAQHHGWLTPYRVRCSDLKRRLSGRAGWLKSSSLACQQ